MATFLQKFKHFPAIENIEDIITPEWMAAATDAAGIVGKPLTSDDKIDGQENFPFTTFFVVIRLEKDILQS